MSALECAFVFSLSRYDLAGGGFLCEVERGKI